MKRMVLALAAVAVVVGLAGAGVPAYRGARGTDSPADEVRAVLGCPDS